MALFTFVARGEDGREVTDTIEASSREAVGQMLRSQGLLPTSIASKSSFNWNLQGILSRLGRVSLLEKITFVKNLAVTIRAGLPVARALGVLAKQMPNPYLRKIIMEIQAGVESGQTLSDSMAKYPRVFPPITVNMIKVGEQSGELDANLEYLATQMGRDYNLIRKTRGAMMYPAVVVFALVIIGYLMLTFVLPKLTSTFKEFDVTLPFITVMIINVVEIFSRYSILILAAIIGLIGFFVYWRKTEGGRTVLHKLTLNFPITGKIAKKINLARFTIIFSGLLRSGMPIVEALKVTSNTMTNLYYQKAIGEASEKVKIGVNLVAALEKYPRLFTPMVTQMILVGEESGTMEKVLAEVSSFYEAEVDDTVKNLSSIIEPLLVMVIGVVVGVMAVGLILPIYNITQGM